MDETQAVYTGMKVVRMVDGEVRDIGELKKDVARRIEMIGRLNDRRIEYMAAGDGESLLRLADEYEQKKMPVMANIVRKEAEQWTVSRRQKNGRQKTEQRTKSRKQKTEGRPLMSDGATGRMQLDG